MVLSEDTMYRMYPSNKHFNWPENLLTLHKIVKCRRKEDRSNSSHCRQYSVNRIYRQWTLVWFLQLVERERACGSRFRASRVNARYDLLTAVPHIKIPSSSEILIDVVDVQRRGRGSIGCVCYRDHGDNRQITGSPTCRTSRFGFVELVGRFLSIFSLSDSDRFEPRRTMI